MWPIDLPYVFASQVLTHYRAYTQWLVPRASKTSHFPVVRYPLAALAVHLESFRLLCSNNQYLTTDAKNHTVAEETYLPAKQNRFAPFLRALV